MAPPVPVLIICHTFPPFKGIGGRRWAKFAKALAMRGHAVHVIHADGAEELKGSLWTADIGHPGIHAYALPQRYPTALFKRPLTALTEKLAHRFWKSVLPCVVRGNWLDRSVFWRKQLLEQCTELMKAHGIRHVIASGAPFRSLTFALKLRKAFPDLRLITDLRDPWTWGDTYGMRSLSAARLAYEQQLEHDVIAGSDRVIAPAEGIIDHLEKVHGADPGKFAVLPHPIDPDDLAAGPVLERDGIYRILYAGSIYGEASFATYFDQVLLAFRTLGEQDPERLARTRFDLYVPSHDMGRFAHAVTEAGLQERIHFHGAIPPSELYAELRRADLVMIFLPDDKKDVLTTKFNELFHLRVPLLHVGTPGRVSETLERRRLGLSIRLNEVQTVLPGVIRGDRPIPLDPNAEVNEHMLGTVCDQLEALLI